MCQRLKTWGEKYDSRGPPFLVEPDGGYIVRVFLFPVLLLVLILLLIEFAQTLYFFAFRASHQKIIPGAVHGNDTGFHFVGLMHNLDTQLHHVALTQLDALNRYLASLEITPLIEACAPFIAATREPLLRFLKSLPGRQVDTALLNFPVLTVDQYRLKPELKHTPPFTLHQQAPKGP